jgi:hypothetical protein
VEKQKQIRIFDKQAAKYDKRREDQSQKRWHGISSNVAVSTLQKTLNPLLYRFSGCHHTRNILEMVRESGMTIEKSESFWFNMAHLIWAKPKF